ncbi:ferredoxin [Candidatus Peregrinibacteria bacterium CG11_big_fil_rev_8_21_14_0_20_41_10]|nr:MAG: ferredoxin [Candidatus Peregrinibacteria bacterium CG11_big_fil_rev_8_21_14_0_20_41_10]PJC37796.1 MAG: ferredoxin [Candidatus Peregrinibacteria bacterium CG_4_9_14_0_2_um_filter_41_14]
MKKIKIIHDRKNCIGCNACVEIAPQNWIMDPEDGKSRLIGSKEKRGLFIGEAFDCDLEANQTAARACPVSIIKCPKQS